MWAWTPAFLTACLTVRGSGAWAAVGSGAHIVGLFHLTGIAASLSMGILSDRLGRSMVILFVGCISTACSFGIGWLIGFPIGVVIAVGMLYAFFALGDSPILSAGIMEIVDPSYLGATLAVRGLLGFGAGAISPIVFGAFLDLVNPAFSHTGVYATWGWSYSVLGLGGLGVVFAAYRLLREQGSK